MALPLKARGQTIGVLDVQSTHPDAFDQEDIAVLSTLADQVAVALDNARLYQASQNALTQVQAIQSQYAQQAWHTYADQLKPQLYEFRLKRPDAGISDDSPIVTLDADSPTQDDQATMSVPLHVHGQVIGALGLQDAPGRTWTDDEIALVETIADQISQAMEAARLFEETQRRAQREQLLTAITDKIRSAHDMDDVLRIAVQEMRRALGVSHAAIRLGTETHLQRTSKIPGPTSAAPKNGDASEPASAKPELDAGDGRDD
jgi:GAF domain-containing protein